MVELNRAFKGKNVLVAGGLGFIGSNVAARLVELGASVSIMDALLPECGGNTFNAESIKDRVQIDIVDMRDARKTGELVKGRDYIFNLAGQISHSDSMNDPVNDMEINCRSQLVLLEACRHKNPGVKIVFASTRQVYGRPSQLPVNEEHPIFPCDINGINKIAGEWYHRLYSEAYGIKTVSLRLINTYGPHILMKHDRQGFIAWFMRRALDGDEIQIYGDGTQVRDFNYVDDVVDALLKAALLEGCWGKVFNLGGGEHINLLELTKLITQISGGGSYRLVPFPSDKKKIDIGSYYADFSKFSHISGWQPRVFLEEGLKKTIDFYRKYKEFYWD